VEHCVMDGKVAIVQNPMHAMLAFLWIGFVCAISFMEAWLKFQAPGITLPLGLGIGRIVFNALNHVEWALALAMLVVPIISRNLRSLRNIWLLIPVGILLIQTYWLLPILDQRAEMHIMNQYLPSSNHHFIYIGLEAVKVIALIIYGVRLFQFKTMKTHTI
jgi:uncharacterized membrane protein (DUF485 family)